MEGISKAREAEAISWMDRVALYAMYAIISSEKGSTISSSSQENVSSRAYGVARKMLAERSKLFKEGN